MTLPPSLASRPALAPVTQALVVLRFPGDAMLPHTSGQSAGNVLLVADADKPYTPINPSRLGTDSVLWKAFPDSAEQTCNSLCAGPLRAHMNFLD